MSLGTEFQDLFTTLQNRLPLVLAIPILATVVILAFRSFSNASDDYPSIPLYTPETLKEGNYQKRWSYDNPNVLREAYTKFPNDIFKIWTSQGNQLGLPKRYLDELKMLPDSKLPSSMRSFLLGDYLWPIPSWKLQYVQRGIHKDLNKHLPSMFRNVKDGIEDLAGLEFPECKDWSPIQVYPTVLRLVSRINAKILVGNGLWENEDWIELSATYTRNIFVSSAKLRIFHPILRPVAQYFIPELRSVWRSNRKAQDLLKPILADKLICEKSADYKKAVDSIEWVRDDTPDPIDKNDPAYHAVAQLIIVALSVNTTTQLTTNTVYNLALWPEYVSILRKEIDDLLHQVGGTWTMENVNRLQKMDSFIKETLRHSGHLTMTFQRKALETITLSDGAQIPQGANIFLPANAINFDPNLYPDPDTFDGLRFYKLRHASPDNEKKFQLTSITAEQMQFGMGRHACPGRSIASHQVKLMLVHLLGRYEFKLVPGEGRPKTLLFQTNQFPDPQGKILFKNRTE